MSRKLELTDQVFGVLTVLGPAPSRTSKSMWRCQCECGTVRIVCGSSLQGGKTKSCGKCFKRLPAGESAFNALFGGRRSDAKVGGHKFELTKDAFRSLTKQPCDYCGAGPSGIFKGHPGSGDYIYNGVDRVDNGLGYVAGNVVACCWDCNRGKGSLSLEAFLANDEEIYKHQWERNNI